MHFLTKTHFVQSEGSLERSVPNDHDDVVDVSLPEDIVNLVGGEAGHVVSVDLQNLVSKPGQDVMLCYEICILNVIICSQSRQGFLYLSPPKAAGESLATRQTKTPLLTAFTFSPIL